MDRRRITGLLLIVVGIVMIISFAFGSSVATPENIIYNYVAALLSFVGAVLAGLGVVFLLIRKSEKKPQ